MEGYEERTGEDLPENVRKDLAHALNDLSLFGLMLNRTGRDVENAPVILENTLEMDDAEGEEKGFLDALGIDSSGGEFRFRVTLQMIPEEED